MIVGPLALYFGAYAATITALLAQGLSPAHVLALPFDGSVGICVFLVAGAGAAWVGSMRARRREGQRARAFAGDRDALPAAKPPTLPDADDPTSDAHPFTFDPTGPLDSSNWETIHEQMRLGWRRPVYSHQRWAPLVGCGGMLGALAALVVARTGLALERRQT